MEEFWHLGQCFVPVTSLSLILANLMIPNRSEFTAYNQEILKKPDLPWIARAEGTFLEIGDFFNISETVSPSPGAEAAWEALQKRKKRGYLLT